MAFSSPYAFLFTFFSIPMSKGTILPSAFFVCRLGRIERMIRKVKICGTEYTMKSSVLTIEAVQREYDKKLLSFAYDLNKNFADALKLTDNVERFEALQDVCMWTLKIGYLMIVEAEPTFATSLNDWLGSLDGIFNDLNWISDVLGVAMSPFRTTFKDEEQ